MAFQWIKHTFLIRLSFFPLTDAGNCEDSPGEEKIQKEIETIDYIDKWVNDKYSN